MRVFVGEAAPGLGVAVRVVVAPLVEVFGGVPGLGVLVGVMVGPGVGVGGMVPAVLMA